MPRNSIDFWHDDSNANMPSYEVQRLLGEIPGGGGDAGEILWVASRIDPNDLDSWTNEWAAMAEEVEQLGITASSERTARDAYLRASNYWRQAAFFTFRQPEWRELSRRAQACFRKALPLLDTKAEIVEIPYKGAVLDGYLIHPRRGSEIPAATVIFGSTIDSTAEEKYFAIGRLLAERGIAVLLWDGPGIGSTLLERGLPAEHDHSAALGATIDWIAARPELDEHRVATIGWGSGGQYALKAGAGEPRLAAVVAWCMRYVGVIGGAEFYHLDTVEELEAAASSGQMGPPLRAGNLVGWAQARNPGGMAAIRAGESQHTLEGVLPGVKCPVLIMMGGADSLSFRNDGPITMDDAERAMSELGSIDKTLVRYPSDGPGSRHVQVDGMERGRAAIADWLVDRLRVVEPKLGQFR